MTTLTLDGNIKLSKTHFVNMNELKIYIYENFWYPEIKEEIEESWYKNWKVDLCNEEFTDISEMKKFYKNFIK